VAYFSDPMDSTFLTKAVGTFALLFSLLAVLLVPVDVFVVSQAHGDLGLALTRQSELRGLYYVLYALILFFVFVLIPFSYFYYEEESMENESKWPQILGALKYTIFFLLIVTILLIVGLLVAQGAVTRTKQGAVGTPKQELTEALDQFGRGDAIIGFMIAVVTVLGLVFWVTYTAFGLINFPFDISPFSRRGSEEADESQEAASDKKLSKMNQQEIKVSLMKTQSTIDYLQAKRELSKKDQQRLKQLTAEVKKLESLQRGGVKPGPVGLSPNCFSKCLCCFTWPIRVALALFAFALSILILVSLAIAVIDRIMNSPCGLTCGFIVKESKAVNPLNTVMVELQKYFPLDYVFFGVLTLYLFLCSFNGLVAGGVRILCLKVSGFLCGSN